MSNKKDVIIYSTDWCGFCKMAKAYLSQKNIPFTEKNVEHDAEAFNELRTKMGDSYGGGVPVLDIGGTLILGFDRPRIDAALGA